MNPANFKARSLLTIALAAAAFFSAAIRADDTVPAVWTPQKVQFTYQGFTTKYTCEALRNKVRSLLQALGARKDDLKVRRSGCVQSPDRPDQFPGVKVEMATLKPAASTDQATVPAQWKTLEFRASSTGTLDRGDCELVEQFKQKFLPLFTTRNVETPGSCVPHQLPTASTMLKLEALVPQEKAAPM